MCGLGLCCGSVRSRDDAVGSRVLGGFRPGSPGQGRAGSREGREAAREGPWQPADRQPKPCFCSLQVTRLWQPADRATAGSAQALLLLASSDASVRGPPAGRHHQQLLPARARGGGLCCRAPAAPGLDQPRCGAERAAGAGWWCWCGAEWGLGVTVRGDSKCWCGAEWGLRVTVRGDSKCWRGADWGLGVTPE